MKKNYNIGLDIGTTSVGWAVIDDDFNIIKKGNKQKSLWGVRLFEEATGADKRRGFRSTRRRYDRRRERIRLLQEEFQEEINKVDHSFYTKLKESFYHKKDSINKTIQLTNEEKELIKKYNQKYPTIYHLRKDLMIKDEKFDIRLVYLAIHHMIKYRGHFNLTMEKFDPNNLNIHEKLVELFTSIFDTCKDIYETTPSLDNVPFKEIEASLLIDNKTDKKKKIEKLFETIFHKKVSKEFGSAFLGYQINLENLFGISLENNKKISLEASDFEEKMAEVENELGEKIEVIRIMKELYDIISLKSIFNDRDNWSISFLMVDNYKCHKNDLLDLKELMKNDRVDFKRFFKTKNEDTVKEELCLYEKYIRNNITREEWYKEIKNGLDKVKDTDNSAKIEEILEKMENQKFMPRITDTKNGIYPYQINQAELQIILEKQGKYYPFLLNKINDEYKIIKLLKFRIPYYVGPLNEHSSFAWLNRKTNEKITPFNFKEVVDIRRSAKNFIYKMLGHCTYLLDEYAVPSDSILYSKFKVLNELKQIKINERKLDTSFQHKIFTEFFLNTKGSLTDKKFKDYLNTTDEITMYKDESKTELEITGYSSELKFSSNMSSFIDFFGDEGIFKDTNLTIQDADTIIELITIFEDKAILKEEILESYPCLENKISKIINKKYKGWSGLSKKLLENPYYIDKETNIKKSIMDLMWEKNENFMQIINNPEYHFQDMIKEENKIEEKEELNYSLVEKLATSPATKRGIYQALKVVQEITDYMGYDPKNITIEMARSNDKKGRIDDRKKRLLTLYDKAKTEINEYSRLKKELQSKEKIDSEKLLLYFIQEGKSLYSKTPLDIHYLELYEVDHILPQAIVKDDSIDNKALVLKEENQIKRDNLVLPSEFRKHKNWWSHLKKVGLISEKKYRNLCRSKFTDKDIEGFINRQLVETRQITKHVANILKNLYQDTNIIYLKANISHHYRERFKLYKYRDLNDYHHAHDAYLASVLGIYQTKYLKTKINTFELKDMIQKLIKEKRYDELKYGYVINSIDQDFVNFDHKTGEVFLNIKDFTDKIENTLYRNDILISKKTEVYDGKFYDETKQKHNQKGVPLKKNLNTKLYGSYTKIRPSYAVVVRYLKKGKVEQRMIGIPIYITKQKEENAITNYITDLLEVEDKESIKIIQDKIPFNTLINWNGQICSLVGATNKVEVCNAKEFNMERNFQIKWKNTLNRLFNSKKKGIEDIIYDNQLNELFEYVIFKIEKEYKLYQNLIPKLKEYINKDTLQEIDIEIKEKTLLELFKLLKFNSQCANLKVLNPNASSAFGRNNEKNISNATIIQKSTIGLKEKSYEF